MAGIVAAHNGGMKAIGVGNSEVQSYCDYFIKGFSNIDESVLIKKAEGV